MKVVLDVAHDRSVNRTATVIIEPQELSRALLSIASAAERNRSGLYMRRHSKPRDIELGIEVGPNSPLRSANEPKKILMADHVRQIHASTLHDGPRSSRQDRFSLQPAEILVSVSDVVSNLLRPCFSRAGFGRWRIFFLEDEPIETKIYWAICAFNRPDHRCEMRFLDIRFDIGADTVRALDGSDLSAQGLEWAVALVPLVKDASPVPTAEIAKSDYDLRQIFGRGAEEDMRRIYAGWFGAWDERIAEVLNAYLQAERSLEVFYHSCIGLDAAGAIHIWQKDAALDGLARDLASQGILAAGLLDSGGSCALYDPWLQGYLNHGWYFREPRGAVICFQLRTEERIPEDSNTWFRRASV